MEIKTLVENMIEEEVTTKMGQLACKTHVDDIEERVISKMEAMENKVVEVKETVISKMEAIENKVVEVEETVILKMEAIETKVTFIQAQLELLETKMDGIKGIQDIQQKLEIISEILKKAVISLPEA